MNPTPPRVENTQPVDSEFELLFARLEKIAGDRGASRDPDLCDRHATDWSGLNIALPRAVIRPASTAELSEMLHLCHEAGQPVTLQGGRTGLAGGAVTGKGEIALSLDRMRQIGAVDRVAGTITAQAGATLQAVQDAAEEAGLFYAVDFGARGTATIGGSISTNAGGIRVLRYGMTRAQVLGLEAVLADGTVLSDMSGIVKNNTGMDLKQLFIGSEGSLGVVTRAVLKLHPKPPVTTTAWLALSSDDAMTQLLAAARGRFGSALGAFEAMWPDYLDTVARRMPGFPIPIASSGGPAIILELLGDDAAADRDKLETFLGEAFEAGLVANAIFAETLDQARRLWAVRDEVPAEYPAVFKALVAFDVSVPVIRMSEAVQSLRSDLIEKVADADRLIYGHMGDDNLHLVLGFQDKVDAPRKQAIETLVYGLVGKLGGSVSAEHGIGRLKRPWLAHTRTQQEIATMRRLKAALDPRGILNPGRVLPDEDRSL